MYWYSYIFQDDQDNLQSVVEAQSSNRSGTAALVVHEKDTAINGVAMEVQTAED